MDRVSKWLASRYVVCVSPWNIREIPRCTQDIPIYVYTSRSRIEYSPKII